MKFIVISTEYVKLEFLSFKFLKWGQLGSEFLTVSFGNIHGWLAETRETKNKCDASQRDASRDPEAFNLVLSKWSFLCSCICLLVGQAILMKCSKPKITSLRVSQGTAINRCETAISGDDGWCLLCPSPRDRKKEKAHLVGHRETSWDTERQGLLCPISPPIQNSNGDLFQNSDIGATGGGTGGGNVGQISSNSLQCLFHLVIDKYRIKSVHLVGQSTNISCSKFRYRGQGGDTEGGNVAQMLLKFTAESFFICQLTNTK